jgi:hypothetical protein
LDATNGIKPDAKQSFKIEVEENPDYYEVPWTIDDVKKFVKVGLRFTRNTYQTLNGARTPGGGSAEWEIDAVNAKGFSIKPVAGGRAWTITWEESIKVTVIGDQVTRSEETVEVNGRKVKCVVYSSKRVQDEWTRTHSYYYAKEYPFLHVKDGYVDVNAIVGGHSSGEWSTIDKVSK